MRNLLGYFSLLLSNNTFVSLFNVIMNMINLWFALFILKKFKDIHIYNFYIGSK